MLRGISAGLIVLVAAHAALAEGGRHVRVASREELNRALGAAQPGDVILLASGTYAGGMSAAGLQGTKEQPIVVAGEDATRPPVIEGGGSGLHLSSPAFLELRDIVFARSTGNGINIDDSGTAQSPAHDLVLKD